MPDPVATKKKRVLLWYWGRRGGGPQYTLALARALADRDDVELFLCLSRQNELAAEFSALGRPTLWIDTYTTTMGLIVRSFFLPWYIRQLTRFIVENRIDIVNSTMTHLWTRLASSSIATSGPALWCTTHDATLHPGEDGPFKRWFFAPIPRAHKHIVLTDFVGGRLTDLFGIPSDRIDVLPHGTFEMRLADTDPAPRVDETGRPPRLRLLFLGRILPYKGLDLLIAAAERLQAEGRPVDLTVAGSGNLGPLRSRIAALPGARLENRWIEEDEIPRFLRDCDVAVLPYREASQSGVVAAAHGAGRPVIVTPIGGLAEQVRDGTDGLIAEDISADAIVGSVRRMFDTPGLLATLTQGARAGRTDLGWPAIAGRLVALAAKDCGPDARS